MAPVAATSASPVSQASTLLRVENIRQSTTFPSPKGDADRSRPFLTWFTQLMRTRLPRRYHGAPREPRLSRPAALLDTLRRYGFACAQLNRMLVCDAALQGYEDSGDRGARGDEARE